MTPSILTPSNTGKSFYAMVDYDEKKVYMEYGIMSASDQHQFDIFIEHNQVRECNDDEFTSENFSFFTL